MAARIVILREERTAAGTHSLHAQIEKDGSLVFEGQDLGDTPQGFWGSREYEWRIAVRADELPRLVTALGGDPAEDDPLELLAARFREDEHYASLAFLEESGIAFEFWSRVGD
jgi:hypothetical protein